MYRFPGRRRRPAVPRARRPIKATKNEADTPRSMPKRNAKTTAVAKVNEGYNFEHDVDMILDEIDPRPLSEDEHVDEEDDIDDIDDIDDTERFEYDEHILKDPATVFRSFSTKADIESGLCVVRSLGKGKYEIVNLQNITAYDLTTPSMTEQLQSNKERLAMFGLDKEDWKKATFICDQVQMNSDAKLFHFLRLPAEIRYIIYKICLHNENKDKKFKSAAQPSEQKFSNRNSILRTCRAVYNEAIIYWRMNTFFAGSSCVMRRDWDVLSVNVRHIHIYMDGSYKYDQLVVAALTHFEHLKSLKIEFAVQVFYGFSRTRAQYTYQNDHKIAKFRQLTGHDVFCSLRGLKHVELVMTGEKLAHINLKVTKEDLKVYETFLQELLTQPKPSKEEILEQDRAAEAKRAKLEATAKAKQEKARSLKRRRMKGKSWVSLEGDEDEYDGTWD